MTKIASIISLVFSLSLLSSNSHSEVADNPYSIGVQIGKGNTTETLTNTTGSSSFNYDISSIKILVGKDYNFWGTGDKKPSRLFLGYNKSTLSSDVAFVVYSIGYQEALPSWSFSIIKPEYLVTPFLAIDIGFSKITQGRFDQDGFGSEIDIGLMYPTGNFELSLLFAYTQIEWGASQGGVSDITASKQIAFALNYKF